jgi:hypothetical protein
MAVSMEILAGELIGKLVKNIKLSIKEISCNRAKQREKKG